MSTIDLTKLRHTAAHLLAMAVTDLYKDVTLGNCGVTDSGFYYDFQTEEPLSSDELAAIQSKMQEIVQNKLPIQIQSKTKEEVEQFFASQNQPYKREILEDIKTRRADILVFGENQFIDLCVSGVVTTTSSVEHFVLTDVSGAYWRGDEKRPMLTRVSGACFGSEHELQSYLDFRAELARRDHRVMGKKLGYFSVDPEIGTGLIFWTPRGKFVKSVLEAMLRNRLEQLKVDFVETPMLGVSTVMASSVQPVEEQLIAKNQYEDTDRWFALRQQVIESHLRYYDWKERSYRDLPWRTAEIGKIVRYEPSGDLEGLVRSREFTQDNVVIVCTKEQVERETELLLYHSLQFLRDLGLVDYEIVLRQPLGDTKAQRQDALYVSGIAKGIARKLSVAIVEDVANAFVGEPEIVVIVRDSLKQKRELTKIQLHLALPLAREVTYVGKDSESHVPVIIRATLAGSVERVIAVLIEHYAGVLPLWLTFEQARVIPVTSKQELYAEKVKRMLLEAGIRTTLDADSEPIEGKIKQAEEDKVPYMLVVGEKEQSTSGVSVRLQGKGDVGLFDLDSFVRGLQNEVAGKLIKTNLL